MSAHCHSQYPFWLIVCVKQQWTNRFEVESIVLIWWSWTRSRLLDGASITGIARLILICGHQSDQLQCSSGTTPGTNAESRGFSSYKIPSSHRFVCCFTSQQHLRWLVTVHFHGDFKVLPKWETKLPTTKLPPWSNIYSVILSWHWANQSLLYPNNA